MSNLRSGIPHIPALDGLRGLAVLAILLFHDERMPGGWLGVDVFFVLSGFLITSLLLAEHGSSGRISLLNFWGRRARRLLPALLALLFGTCGYAALFAQPEELARIRADTIATLFYVANWHSIVAGHEYWEMFRLPPPLDHTWSLAIEEQFYLLWPPLALGVLWKFKNSAKALQVTASCLALLSAGWMAALYDPSEGTARVYFGTDTRIAATLVGSALAAGLRSQVASWPAASARALDVSAAMALLLLVAASFLLEGSSPLVYRGGLFALVIAVAFVIAGPILCPAGLVARVLGFAPLRGLGIVSYGVYLWHWPVYLVLTAEHTTLEGWALTGLRIAVTLLISIVSYYGLEQPVRRGVLPARAARRGGALGGVAVIVCVWLVTDSPSGRLATPAGDAARVGALNVLVVGDSLAGSVSEQFPEEAWNRGYRAQVLSGPACGALASQVIRDASGELRNLEACAQLREQWLARAEEAKPRLVLVLEGWPGERDKKIGEEWGHPCQQNFDRVHARDLRELVEGFQERGASVAITIAPKPSVADLRKRFISYAGGGTKEELDASLEKRVACLNAVRREVAVATAAKTIDLDRELCPQGDCRRRRWGLPIRPDGLHFQGYSASWVSGWLLDRIEELEIAEARPGKLGARAKSEALEPAAEER